MENQYKIRQRTGLMPDQYVHAPLEEGAQDYYLRSRVSTIGMILPAGT